MTYQPPVIAPAALLFFQGVLVARLTDVFCSDLTFYAQTELAIDDASGDQERAVLAFVRFTIDWYRRCDTAPPPSASEFDAFREFIGPGKWRATWGKEESLIIDAPAFINDREVSWSAG